MLNMTVEMHAPPGIEMGRIRSYLMGLLLAADDLNIAKGNASMFLTSIEIKE